MDLIGTMACGNGYRRDCTRRVCMMRHIDDDQMNNIQPRYERREREKSEKAKLAEKQAAEKEKKKKPPSWFHIHTLNSDHCRYSR